MVIKPRSGVRMQPTAQAVGTKCQKESAPEGRKKSHDCKKPVPQEWEPARLQQRSGGSTFVVRFSPPFVTAVTYRSSELQLPLTSIQLFAPTKIQKAD